jgi:hypothetical protein
VILPMAVVLSMYNSSNLRLARNDPVSWPVPMNSILPIVVVSINLSFKQDLISLLILEEDHP